MKRRLKSMAVLFLCAIIFLGSLSGAKTALAAGEYTVYIVENPTGLIEDIYILKPDGSKEIVYCYNREYSWPDYEGVSGNTKVPYSGVSHEKSQAIKMVVKAGYPINFGNYMAMTGITEAEFRAATQHAVWHFTDNYQRIGLVNKLDDPTYGTRTEELRQRILDAFDYLVSLPISLDINDDFNFYEHPEDKLSYDGKFYQNLFGGFRTDIPAKREVTFSKVEVNGTEELPGASLKIVRGETADGEIVSEWVSTSTQNKISLEVGTFTMVETNAPTGYEIAESITFRITLDRKIEIKNGTYWEEISNATIKMEDKKTPEVVEPTKKEVTFSKVEVNGTVELPGATLKVVKGETVTGELVSEWISTSAQNKITLEEGTYTMVETNAPTGYEIAESITFRVTKEGTVEIKNGDTWTTTENSTIKMEDKKTPVVEPTKKEETFGKVEFNGTIELPGATLKVVKGETEAGELVSEWVSTTTQNKITLEEGTYTMVETNAPTVYEIAESITFRVTKEGTVEIKNGDTWTTTENSTIKMEDKKIPEKPVTPEKPVIPENPVTPEKPVVPENPVTPEKPVVSEKPVVPEKPVTDNPYTFVAGNNLLILGILASLGVIISIELVRRRYGK